MNRKMDIAVGSILGVFVVPMVLVLMNEALIVLHHWL